MSQRQRFGLLAVAAVVITVAAFIVLRPGDDSSGGGSGQRTAAPSATRDTSSSGDGTTAPTPTPKPQYVQIRARGLQPVGGVKEITVKKGDTVRLAVSSDRADEGHLHGYDISKPVGPSQTARYTFKADIEGIFELELENAAVKLASLKVEP